MSRKSLLLLLCCLLAWPTLVLARPGDATALPDHITLTLAGDPATTMTVTWRTSTAVTSGVVQYRAGDAAAQETRQARATTASLSTDLGTVRIHTATLKNLTAGTPYTYRVGDGTRWSATHTFTTADPEARAVKFLVFGDSQSVPPYTTWQKTLHNAFRAHPDARFLINVGDLVDTGQSAAHWHAWFTAGAGVIDTIPVMPVTGNHESYGVPRGKPTYFTAQFHLPQNGPAELKNQVYSFNYGPVHFAALDSQQGELRAFGDILPPQKRWLEADLAAAQARWTIAYFHKGPYALNDGRPNPSIKAAFCPILERHHVDVVFNGHDHGIARTYPMKNGARAASPTQGTVYITAGRSGTKTYQDIERQSYHAFFANPTSQPNYLVVEATETTLTVTAYKQDGSVVDRYTIEKDWEARSMLPARDVFGSSQGMLPGWRKLLAA